ncbi:hypothetical protein E2320_014402, partial [Naja naja]
MECGKLLDPPLDTSSTPKNHKKPHECSECGKSFTRKSLLLTHRKVHVRSGSSKDLETQVREAESGSVPHFQPRAHPAQLEGRGSHGGSLQAVLNLRPFRSYNRPRPQKVLYD